MIKKIGRFLTFFILGIIAAGVFQIVLVPFLVSNPFFGKFEIIKKLKREIIVNPVEQFIIDENEGLKKAIEKIESTTVLIGPEKGIGGCGFSLTSDGLLITQLSLIDENQNFIFVNGKKTQFRILDKDPKNNLILIKTEDLNLKTTSFAQDSKIKPGERVFLFAPLSSNSSEKIINEGIIKRVNKNLIETNILEKKSFDGCPLFNLEGQFVGLAKISDFPGPADLNQLFIFPAFKIRAFAGL